MNVESISRVQNYIVQRRRETSMLYYSIVFFIIALVAAVLGFGGLAGTMAGIAQVLFWIFVVLFVISLIFGRRGRP